MVNILLLFQTEMLRAKPLWLNWKLPSDTPKRIITVPVVKVGHRKDIYED